MLNESIRYVDGHLYMDGVNLATLACETPTYIYSLPRIVRNYQRIRDAFADFDAHIHYSAKANANLTILRTLVNEGAGVDAVSAGEAFRALKAGCAPENIVFAGVGKRRDELEWAVENGIGWFNVENVRELELLNEIGGARGKKPQIALRLNPEVTANTHPYIATGHGGAKFGLTRDVVTEILANQADYPHIVFGGIHVHVGSQLGDTTATESAVAIVRDILTPYPAIRTINIGGGMPASYEADKPLPTPAMFASALKPLLSDYSVIIEPGRSIVADAGVLIVEVQYIKRQAGQRIVIIDGSMTELIRPALYQAKHGVIPLIARREETSPAEVVGPVCETADTLGHAVPLPELQPGDRLAIMTAGAYGMVMASNYNARPRPAELVVNSDGQTWQVARQRETWDDLIRQEI